VFTVKVDEGWEDEYADFTMVKGDFSTTAGTKHCEFIKLRIWNGDYQAPAQDLTGEITVSEPNENGIVEIGYNGPENVTMTVTINGEVAEAPYQLAEGDNTIVVTVEAEGYNTLEDTFIRTYTVLPTEKTGAPTFNGYTTEGVHAFYLEIIPTEPSDIYYRVQYGQDGEFTEWAEYENILSFTVDGWYRVEAYAVAVGKLPSEQIAYEFTLKPAEPSALTGEITVSEPDENGIVEVGYNGPEDVNVTVTINGEVAEAPYQLAEGDNEVVVTVTAPGYEPMEKTFNVTYTAPVVPVYTAVPTVTFEVTDDAYTFTAAGDGEVVLYVNGEAVENPYTIARPEAGEAAIEVSVYATAQEAGKEMSQSEVQTFVIEPKAGEQPTDPHMQGKWLVVIDMFGNHNWFPLTKGANNDYVTTVSLEYYTYGLYDPDPENAAQVPFDFVVDGVQYGDEEPMTVAAIGHAMENPLSESEEY
jgi:hypothetical protein